VSKKLKKPFQFISDKFKKRKEETNNELISTIDSPYVVVSANEEGERKDGVFDSVGL
jgi:hypothetical protein